VFEPLFFISDELMINFVLYLLMLILWCVTQA